MRRGNREIISFVRALEALRDMVALMVIRPLKANKSKTISWLVAVLLSCRCMLTCRTSALYWLYARLFCCARGERALMVLILTPWYSVFARVCTVVVVNSIFVTNYMHVVCRWCNGRSCVQGWLIIGITLSLPGILLDTRQVQFTISSPASKHTWSRRKTLQLYPITNKFSF